MDGVIGGLVGCFDDNVSCLCQCYSLLWAHVILYHDQLQQTLKPLAEVTSTPGMKVFLLREDGYDLSRGLACISAISVSC